MNDKKNISVYLPTSFIPEIEEFIKVNNIPSRGEFFYAAARFYMENSNQNLIESDSDSNIKSIKELPVDSSNQNLIKAIESSNRNLIEKLDTLIEHIQAQSTSTKVPDESGIDILYQINKNLEKLSSSLSNSKPIQTSQVENNKDTMLSTKTQEPTKKNDKTDLQKKTEQALEKYCQLPNYASFSHTTFDPTDEEFQAFLENYSYDYEEDRTTIVAAAADKLNSTRRIAQFLKMLYDKSCDDAWKNIYIELRKKNEFYLKDVLYWTEDRRLYIEEHPEHAAYLS